MKLKLLTLFLIVLTFVGLNVSAETDSRDVVRVPALMYHCVDENINDVTISQANFRKHLEVIKENGYTPISVDELIDFVNNGTVLPTKPVCITFDDGYMDNYLNAYPLLKEFDFKATIFAIGSSVGKSTYKETGKPIFPHFGFDEAKEMIDSGLISVQSHTFDMHQARDFESGFSVRENLLPIRGESLREYLLVLENDVIIQKTFLETNLGETMAAMAYPIGKYNGLVELVLKKNGVRASFATSVGPNYVRKNNRDSLYSLNRYNIHDAISAEQLLEWLDEE
ncbi:MAG: polysaccharide deacetylase family protein [Clostridia bacterium]|nr:polysaccharide deacetylase family protein [Clostridia bacterium]